MPGRREGGDEEEVEAVDAKAEIVETAAVVLEISLEEAVKIEAELVDVKEAATENVGLNSLNSIKKPFRDSKGLFN